MNEHTTSPPSAHGGGAAGAPAPPPPPRRLVRYPDHGPLAGVCAGLGASLDVDPVWVRIVMVLLTLFTFPLGLLLYVVLWVAMPVATDIEPPPSRPRDPQQARTWVGVALLAIGGLWLAGQLLAVPLGGLLGVDPLGGVFTSGALIALLLIAGGVALLVLDRRGEDERAFDPAGTGAAREPHPPAATAGAAMAPSAATPSPAVPRPAAPAPPPGEAPSRSSLGRLTAGAAMIVAGVLWLVHQAGLATVGPVIVLSALLLVLGGGLLVGTWWGRGRGLIGWGVLVALPLLAAAWLGETGLPVRDGVGEQRWQPQTAAELGDRYALSLGEAELDLGAVELDGAEVVIETAVGMGQLTVIVPDDADVAVTSRVGIGESDLLGRVQSGVGGLRDHVDQEVDDPAGALDIDASVAIGELRVVRAGER